MNKKIWLSSPHMSGNELKYIIEAFDTNWVAPIGPNINGFEQDLSKYLNVKSVAALTSGTAAIHLALILLGVKSEDEVIAQSFTFSATVNPIVYLGAKPVFIDSEWDTWNMSPELLEKAINDRISKGKKPKAIIIANLYGMPAKLDEILSISKKYDIPIIEDSAEGLGSTYKGKKLGAFGDFGVLSFNGNKIITTSGGGALVSKNDKHIETARFLATQARDKAPYYQHSHIGYNYRMSNILAGIGRGQMKVIDLRVEQRRANHQFYKDNLEQIPGVSVFTEREGFFSNYWLTTILIDPNKTKGITTEDVRLSLEKENIETRPLWKPMHMQPIFKDYPAYCNGVSEELFKIGLCLPSGSNLTDDDRNRILKALLKVF
ncbi:MAG: aminotransferase class I/II-fold pyridoxal phosphate-dependent enzyme [Bacteroidetes bacterium]|nr:aminotransferase class I/II-fold pyridoxal phosphate-dependent enzyme [Bacteroidota bacterium]